MNEQRKHPRISFSLKDGIVARFLRACDSAELQTAYVLNLSEGGLFFTLREDQQNLIREGENLRFLEIKKWRSKQFLVNIQANVVWMGNLPEENCMGVGCEFRNISEKNVKNIQELIEEKTLPEIGVN